jgi:hypothetical protein
MLLNGTNFIGPILAHVHVIEPILELPGKVFPYLRYEAILRFQW